MPTFDMHAPVWTANAAAIGLTPAQATAFASLATAAHNAYTAKLAADQAARAATVSLHAAVGDARRSAGDLIRTIKAFAESQSKPDVIYNLAQIPPPAQPSPAPPPARPSDLAVSLDPTTGALDAFEWLVGYLNGRPELIPSGFPCARLDDA